MAGSTATGVKPGPLPSMIDPMVRTGVAGVAGSAGAGDVVAAVVAAVGCFLSSD
jgi:hypothetical protein